MTDADLIADHLAWRPGAEQVPADGSVRIYFVEIRNSGADRIHSDGIGSALRSSRNCLRAKVDCCCGSLSCWLAAGCDNPAASQWSSADACGSQESRRCARCRRNTLTSCRPWARKFKDTFFPTRFISALVAAAQLGVSGSWIDRGRILPSERLLAGFQHYVRAACAAELPGPS